MSKVLNNAKKAQPTFKMQTHQGAAIVTAVAASYASNALGRITTMRALGSEVPEGLPEWAAGAIGIAVLMGVVVYLTRPIPRIVEGMLPGKEVIHT